MCDLWFSVLTALIVGQVFTKNTMYGALKKARIKMPDCWDKIEKALKFTQQLPISIDIFFESWHAYAQECQPSWNQLAHALECTGIFRCKQAATQVQQKEGMYI